MKQFILFAILLAANISWGQQNFINVPSSEATTKNKLFFQQQLNFNELTQANTTLDYGLGKGFEIGANVLGLNFSDKKKSFLNNDTNDVDPFNPLILINGLKQFNLNEKVSFAMGAQYGLNFRKNRDTYQASLFYTNCLIEDVFIKKSKWVGGLYFNSRHYGGKGTRLQCWIAIEMPVTKKIHIMTESVLGDNALSYTSIGLIYYPKPYLPLTFGVEIPNVKRNSYALVFELTFVPETN